MWLRRGVLAGSHSLEEVGDQGHKTTKDFFGVPGLTGHVGIVRKRLQIARRKRSKPKDRKRPLSKRFETLDAQRPRNVSVTTRPMFHFFHGAPCVHGREHEIPLVAIDYKSFGQSGENEH